MILLNNVNDLGLYHLLNAFVERPYLIFFAMKLWRHFNQRQAVDGYGS